MVSARMLLGLLAGLSAGEAISPEARPSQPEEGRRIMRGEASRRGASEIDHDQTWAEVSPGTQAVARAWRNAADQAEAKADEQHQLHAQASPLFADKGFDDHLKQQRKRLDEIKKKESEEATIAAESQKEDSEDAREREKEEEKEAADREARTEHAAAEVAAAAATGSALQRARREGVPEPQPLQQASVAYVHGKKPEEVDETEQAEISRKEAERKAKEAANVTVADDDDDTPKTHKQLMEAVLPSYFLAAGSISCTTACQGHNMACDDQALKLVSRMPADCQWVLTRLGKAVNFGGVYPYDNSGCNYDGEGQGWYKVNKQNNSDPECDSIPSNGRQRVCSCLKGTQADTYAESSHRRRVNRRRRHYWEAEATANDSSRVGNFDGLREQVEVIDEGLDRVETELNGHLRSNVAHVANLLGIVRERISLQSAEAELLERRVQALGTRDSNGTAQAIAVLQGEMVNLSNWMGVVEHGLFNR